MNLIFLMIRRPPRSTPLDSSAASDVYKRQELSSKLKSCVIDSSPRGNLRPSDHAPVMIDLNLNDINVDFYEDEDNFFEI